MRMRMRMTMRMRKKTNDFLDKIIYKTKSFEEQIKLLKKEKNLSVYYHERDYGDKELKFKIFKLRLAYLSNIIDEKLFKQIFGHTFETLANKLIHTTNKEENQILVNDIEKNNIKLCRQDKTLPYFDFVIRPNDRRVNLLNASKHILDFNKTIQLDLV